MTKPGEEGVEVVRSPSAGGLSILTKENETLPSFEDVRQEEGQEATLVEEERISPANKSVLGSIFFKSLRRKKQKRTSIILPPQLSLALNVDERRREANQKATYARRLLEAAFRPPEEALNKQQHPAEFEGMTRIDMIETSFKYAVEARRMIGASYNQNDEQDEDCFLDDHRAQGEAAALEAHHFILACKSKALLPNMDEGEEDVGSIDGGLYTPQDIQDAANKHREKAHYHLECILSTFEKKIKAPDHIILNSSPERNGEDGMTLSTLGFDNTFQESPTSKEKFSITSLNELMDASLISKPAAAVVAPPSNRELPPPPPPQPDSPLSGTVESRQEIEVEQKVVEDVKSSVEDKVLSPPQTKEKTNVKAGTLSLPTIVVPKRKRKSQKVKSRETKKEDAASSSTSSGDVSAISELESIRALEDKINNKLKKAAKDDSDSFSLVGDEALIEAPKFVSAPSFDPSIMSLENWDNLADGSSLDEIVKKAEAEKERKIREEKNMLPALEPEKVRAKHSRVSRLWRSRSEAFAPKVEKPTPNTAALESYKVRRVGGKKPDVIPPPFVTVTCEERVRSSLDDVAPKYQVASMSILGLDAAPANDDAFSNNKDKRWKKILPVRKIHPPIKGRKRWSKGAKDLNSEHGVYHGDAKGITTSTDSDVLSWHEMRVRSSNSNEALVGSDKYRTLADDVDSAIEKAEKHHRDTEDPLDSGIAMLLNNANPDVVRQVLSADAGKVEQVEAGKPVDFVDVEIEGENAKVQTQKALASRDAVLENIYADRNATPVTKAPKPLARSGTHGALEDQHLEPSRSFLELIDKEKAEAEERRQRPKRMSSFFRRNRGKDKETLLV